MAACYLGSFRAEPQHCYNKRPMLTNEQRQFLDAQRVIRLATADASGIPHLVPLCFALNGETVYIAGGANTKRMRNVMQNPRVALLADHYVEDWSVIGYVLLFGTALGLPVGEEHARASSLLKKRYSQFEGDPYRIVFEEGSMLVVHIERVVAYGKLAA
jgi:coenzyme F420-0:L-glutamate ligase/coenzyme F420-1:gamma-L-glutamate ligase